MDVKDRLTSILSVVHDGTIATFVEPFATGNIANGRHHMAENVAILIRTLRDGRNVALGNHENVRWSDRANVTKSENVVVFKNNGGLDFSANNAAEKATFGCAHDGRSYRNRNRFGDVGNVGR